MFVFVGRRRVRIGHREWEQAVPQAYPRLWVANEVVGHSALSRQNRGFVLPACGLHASTLRCKAWRVSGLCVGKLWGA